MYILYTFKKYRKTLPRVLSILVVSILTESHQQECTIYVTDTHNTYNVKI